MNHQKDSYLHPEQKSDLTKHILYRAGFLVMTVLILIYAAAYMGNGWWVLTAMFVDFAIAGIWFIFILIEGLILYSKKKNKLAGINMMMIAISLVIGGILFFYLNH